MENSNPHAIRKSWWDRNWRWLIPTGCVSLLILLCLFITGIFFGVTAIMKDSEVYKEAIAKVKQNKEVVAKLGSPITADEMASGSIQINNDTGNCDLKIPIKGPKGTATLVVIAQKNGKWKYSKMAVTVTHTKEEIDLLP